MTNETVIYIADQVKEVIGAISEKLGIATGMLWPILVKQQVICGWQFIIASLILVLLVIFLSILIWKMIKKENEEYERIAEFGSIPYFLIPILIFTISVPLLMSGIGHIINPEYYAITDIINAIKNR